MRGCLLHTRYIVWCGVWHLAATITLSQRCYRVTTFPHGRVHCGTPSVVTDMTPMQCNRAMNF